jgi:antitoxin ParD1/3/4
MSRDSKISVVLTPELEAAVNHAVESGEYASSSEVVREALSNWKERRSFIRYERELVREQWAEGVASGPGRFESMAAIKSEARRRLMEDKREIKG